MTSLEGRAKDLRKIVWTLQLERQAEKLVKASPKDVKKFCTAFDQFVKTQTPSDAADAKDFAAIAQGVKDKWAAKYGSEGCPATQPASTKPTDASGTTGTTDTTPATPTTPSTPATPATGPAPAAPVTPPAGRGVRG